ncbi:B-cell differentiation antigen CD72-like [Varanus komodoensis]|uniref:B-cell differentiation antigen CD72-like n=1 Tax=Varanus komodoensis TaxID=61221 RepID=UPI001CF7E101|nr:B-cell differentiation antigen CD72-like [Varanus komodoensis]
MSEGVTYADLKFVRRPPREDATGSPWAGQPHPAQLPPTHAAPSSPPEASEAELTYENVQVARPGDESAPSGSQPSQGWSRKTWYVVWAFTGTCIFLLATTIGFGLHYGQLSQHLQQESEARRVHSLVLTEKIHAREESLEQLQESLHEAESELNATRVGLWESRMQANRTQRVLEQREAVLSQASLNLTKQQKALEEQTKALEEQAKVVEELRASLEEARQKIGCCSTGWVLFRRKCLWISTDRKSWKDSITFCRWKTSQLAILRSPWNPEDLWAAEGLNSHQYLNTYWIGLSYSTYSGKWTWGDGAPLDRELNSWYSGDCGVLSDGRLSRRRCDSTSRFICEKAPQT